MMGYIGPAGPTTTIAAPFGYGQDEDKYEGPTFPHVPTVVRPVRASPTLCAVPFAKVSFSAVPAGASGRN